jgi:hypothetical protein
MVLLNEMNKELSFGGSWLVHPVAGRLLLKGSVQVNVLRRPVLNLPPWIHKDTQRKLDGNKGGDMPTGPA